MQEKHTEELQHLQTQIRLLSSRLQRHDGESTSTTQSQMDTIEKYGLGSPRRRRINFDSLVSL